MRFAFLHGGIVVFLTLLTQIGGLAWLLALSAKRKLIAFLAIYFALTIIAVATAPLAGRTALHCWGDGPLQMRAWFFCLTNRNYMAPELLAALEETALALATEFPDSEVQVLDAGFPFLDGFPLLPHLSHDDGEKVDLAFIYEAPTPLSTPSPIGYFAFEDGPTQCTKSWPTLRWDMIWLQPLWPKMTLDDVRNKRLLEMLADHPDISKILLEPHLKARWSLTGDKIRFQGCRAARHDDHIHLQL